MNRLLIHSFTYVILLFFWKYTFFENFGNSVMVDELNIRDQKLGILPLRTIWMVPNISVTLLLFSDGANGLRWGGVNVHPYDGAREMQMMMPQLPYRQLRAAQTQTSMWTFANYGKPP